MLEQPNNLPRSWGKGRQRHFGTERSAAQRSTRACFSGTRYTCNGYQIMCRSELCSNDIRKGNRNRKECHLHYEGEQTFSYTLFPLLPHHHHHLGFNRLRNSFVVSDAPCLHKSHRI